MMEWTLEPIARMTPEEYVVITLMYPFHIFVTAPATYVMVKFVDQVWK